MEKGEGMTAERIVSKKIEPMLTVVEPDFMCFEQLSSRFLLAVACATMDSVSS